MEDEDSIVRYEDSIISYDYTNSIYNGYSLATLTSNGIVYGRTPVEVPIKVVWAPKEDVTPYELAMCTTLIFMANFDQDKLTPEKFTELIKDMDPKMLRHFDIDDPNFNGTEWDIIK